MTGSHRDELEKRRSKMVLMGMVDDSRWGW